MPQVLFYKKACGWHAMSPSRTLILFAAMSREGCGSGLQVVVRLP